MATKKIEFYGNTNIGLFGYSTNKKLIIGINSSKYEKDLISNLGVDKIIETSIMGIPLVGIFIVGKEDTILVPSQTYDYEIENLQKDFKVIKINTIYSALANNIYISENLILVNKDIEDEVIEELKKIFNLPVKRLILNEHETIGEFFVENKNGILISEEIIEDIPKEIKKMFKKEIMSGTINFGNSYLKSGIITNDNGLLVGSLSSGHEIINAENILGFTRYQ